MIDWSFVVPCYNEEKHIWACLNSIRNEISRNPQIRAEIIVADNGSRDKTGQIAATFADNMIIVPEKGIVPARQGGFNVARGEFVALIDADNVLPLNWLRTAIAAFDEGTVALSGPLVYYDLPFYVRALSKGFYGLAWLSHQALPMLQGGNFIVRRDALESVGGFDHSFPFMGEDTSQAVRLAKVGKIKFVPSLWIYSSGRRLRKEGVIYTTFVYVLNYYAAHFLGRPVTKDYRDIRL